VAAVFRGATGRCHLSAPLHLPRYLWLPAASAEPVGSRSRAVGDTDSAMFTTPAGWPGFREARLSRERGSGSSRGFGFAVSSFVLDPDCILLVDCKVHPASKRPRLRHRVIQVCSNLPSS